MPDWRRRQSLLLAAAITLLMAGVGGRELMGGLPAAGQRARAGSFVIDWNDVRQRIDGFGASCYANIDPDFVLANPDLAFDREKGVGLSLHRMTFPWNAYGGDKSRVYKCPEIAQLAQARGAKNWAAPWYPPAKWKNNRSIFNGGFLLPRHYQDYATLLADSVLQMKSEYGVDLYAVSIQNEPDYAAPWGSCTWTADQFHTFVPILARTFAQKGVSTKIMMPEMSGWTFSLADKTMQDPTTAQHIGILAAHAYNMPSRWVSPYAAVRPVWQTEQSVGADDDHGIGTAIKLAMAIHFFMTRTDINAWHAWILDVLMKGKRIYTLGNFSKFVRPGYVRLGVTDPGGVYVSAYKHSETGAFVVVVVNPGSSAMTRTFSLNGFNATSVTPWVTSAGLNLEPQPGVAIREGMFTATFEGSSVTTFVGTASGSGP